MARLTTRGIAVVGGLCLLAGLTGAQAPVMNPIGRVRVKGSAARSPIIQASAYSPLNFKKQEWYQIECAYETNPDWTDELTLTFYVLMKTDDAKEPFVLLKGEDSFIHIAKGTHQARAFVHPSLINRYGKVEGHAVEFKFQDRLVHVEASSPQDYPKWIAQLSPKNGHVLQPRDTPFAHLDFDAFELSKPRAGP